MTAAWVRQGLTLVAREVDERPVPRAPVDVSALIACPACGAHVGEGCRTTGGNSTVHRDRIVSRTCPCGASVGAKKTYCEPCRQARREATYRRREIRTPTAQRRRESA